MSKERNEIENLITRLRGSNRLGANIDDDGVLLLALRRLARDVEADADVGKRARVDSVRDVAMLAVEEIAGELREADATLTVAASIAKALDTPTGKKLQAAFIDRDAHLAPKEWLEKRRQSRALRGLGLGETPDSAISELAKGFVRDNMAATFEDGLAHVRRRHPALWQAYERERA